MEFKEKTFSITVESNSIIFSGKMELAHYKPVLEFLKQAESNIAGLNLIINLKQLDFLNSAGIRTIAVFILETARTVDVIIDEQKTWQNIGIIPLQNMKAKGLVNIKS